jgi:hypothetical protein
MKFMNPTGMGIRSDAGGDGKHGAKRGLRLHDGVDFECVEGQNIRMPFSGVIVRTSLPYKNDLVWRGVHIVHSRIEVKMWYFLPHKNLIRAGEVKIGTMIGIAQDIGKKKGYENVTPHLHVRVVKIDPTLVIPIGESL